MLKGGETFFCLFSPKKPTALRLTHFIGGAFPGDLLSRGSALRTFVITTVLLRMLQKL